MQNLIIFFEHTVLVIHIGGSLQWSIFANTIRSLLRENQTSSVNVWNHLCQEENVLQEEGLFSLTREECVATRAAMILFLSPAVGE